MARELELFGVFNRLLQVEIAYQGPDMEAIREPLLAALASLHPQVPWLPWYSTVTPPDRALRLPAYPWQRQRLWKDGRPSREDKLGRPGATWLWQALPAPDPALQVDINPDFFLWLNDHQVNGRVVFPGAAYVAAALALKFQVYADAPCSIEDLEFRVTEATLPLIIDGLRRHGDRAAFQFTVRLCL